MGTDCLYQKRSSVNRNTIRKKYTYGEVSWLLVCEGEKTEPNYFKGLELYLKQELGKEFKLKFVVEGEGRNTLSLVKSVDNYLDEVNSYIRSVDKKYDKIFVIFDKDSFKSDDFDNAIHKCKSRGYISLWSNECFELWYLLHFDYYDSNIDRKSYKRKLSMLLINEYNVEYKKNDTEMFNKIKNKTSVACKNARKLMSDSCEEGSFAKRSPCTNMIEFIEILNDELKGTEKEGWFI